MVTMNCTDKLAKKLGFTNKADLIQFFELFPESHTKVKQFYKQEYEDFYSRFTSQSIEVVQNSLKTKKWTAEGFSKANVDVEKDKKLRWQILIDTAPYNYPVSPEKMQVLEQMAGDMNFE